MILTTMYETDDQTKLILFMSCWDRETVLDCDPKQFNILRDKSNCNPTPQFRAFLLKKKKNLLLLLFKSN